MDQLTPPKEIKLHTQSKELELVFEDASYRLSFEFLRVHSPSAEVRGHGPGQEVLQTGKECVRITQLEPSGNYALKIVFDDGHDSGLYSWSYLRELGENKEQLWQAYLDKLEAAGESRNQSLIGKWSPP